MGFFDDTDTAVAEKPEAPKTSGSFFEDTDTTTTNSFFEDADSVKIDPISIGAQPEEDTLSDDWSGFVANMRMAGNRLTQGVAGTAVDSLMLLKEKADKASEKAQTFGTPEADPDDYTPSQWMASRGASMPEGSLPRRKYEEEKKRMEEEAGVLLQQFQRGAAVLPEFAEYISQKEKRIKELTPSLSPEMRAMNEANGAEFWKLFASNPVETISNTIASSLIVGSPAIAGAIIGGGGAGRIGVAIGAGLGSYYTEVSQSILDSMRDQGVDLTNPDQVMGSFSNPATMSDARSKARDRGVPVAAFDALTAGLAGRFVGPVLKETAPATWSVLKATAKEAGMQMAGGASGEAAAEFLSGEEFSVKDIALEGIAEIGSGFAEAAMNLKRSGAPLTAQALETQTEGGETIENETERIPDSTGALEAGDAQREAERGGEVLSTPGVQSPESTVQPSGESSPRTDVPNREEVLTTEGEVPTPAPVTSEPSEVPQQQESPTEEVPKVLTTDERAVLLQPHLQAAQAAAQASGATDPEDAAQVAWIKVSNSEKPLDNPRAVLIDAARSEAKSQLSKANAQKRGGGMVEGADVAELEEAAVETRGPRAEAISKEDMDGIARAIETLNENETRVARVLMRGEDLSNAEIAEELGLAVGTVKNIKMKIEEVFRPYAERMGFGQSLGPGAASASEVLTRYEQRRFAKRFQEDEGISEDIRNQSGENYYEPIPMVQNARDAAKLIKERGADQVAAQITDPNQDITFAQRVTVGVELLTRLDQQYKAEQESNPEAAKITLEKAIVLNEWMKQYGTSLGQGINAFKSWSNRLILHKLVEQLIESNGGQPLTNEQMELVNKTDKGLKETQEKFEEREEFLETKASNEHADLTLSDRLKETKGDTKDPLVLSIAERIEAFIKKQADAARARIRDRLQYAKSGIDPVVLYDVTWLAAEQIAKGIRKLSQWRKIAHEEFGEEIDPYIDQAWEDANANIDRLVEEGAPKEKRDPITRIVKKMTGEEARTELTKRITTEVKDGGTLKDLVPLIRRLADKFIESGIKTREPLIDALHGVIEPLLPGTSKREVQDAFSGYGQFRELSKDEVSKTRRELAAQSQLASKAEDVLAKKPLLKSGVERAPVSDTQRRMQAELNELKRRLGVVSTDPAKQLRSAQDAIKTRLKNEIKDLGRQIETGEKPPQKSQTEWDAEIETLKAQRDRIKETLSSLENTEISEEQRVKNAERALEKSIEEIQKRINNKDVRSPKGTPLESEKLSVLRAQKEVLQAELEELRSADTALQDEKKFDALMKQADQLENQLKFQGPPKPESSETKAPEDPLVSEARGRVKELREQLRAAKASSPESLQAKIDKAIASVESSIKALDSRLQSGDISTKEKSPEVTTPELERLRAERAAMVKELNRQRREAAKPSESEIQAKKDAKQIENLEKSIAALTQKINAKDLSTKRTGGKPTTEEAKRLSEYKKYLQDFLNDMRRDARPKRSPEEVAIKALKTRLAKQNADLESRIARGDFAKRTPRTLDISSDPEAVRLKSENTRIRKEFEKKRLLYERQNRTKLQKAFDTGKEVLNLPRNIMSSMDFSAVFRQGGMLTFANPVRAAKALGPMLKSAFSEKNFQDLQSSLELRPNAKDGTYKKAGLYLAETGDVKLSKKEEAIMSEWGDRIPFVKASNRAYVAFLNKMRADTFDVLYEQLQKNGAATEEEVKALGNYVNVATGRGNLGTYNEGAATLALFLFSPRLMVSRFQLLMGQPGWKGSGRTRTLIAKEYGKVALALATFTALAINSGAEWEDDPTSSDFMKLKFGNTRVDPWMGLIQPLVLSMRAKRGEVKKTDGKVVPIRGKVPYGQDDWADLAAKFVRSKLNPSVGGGVDLITGKNVVGETAPLIERSAENIPLTNIKGFRGVLPKLLTPLSLQDMPKVWAEHGMDKGTALNLAGILGMGVQNYPAKTTPNQRALEIMASPR